MTTDDTVAVFDIGGTHARSAVLAGDGRLHDLTVRAAPSWAHCPGAEPAALHRMLVEQIAADARRLAGRHKVSAVGVSLGAAIDARTGLTVGSGPLWGDGGQRFDTAGALRDAAPEFRWTVANDVTATAVALAARPEARGLRRLAAVVVGSGIALRTIEVGTGRVPAAADTGLQGEIGHLPAEFRLGTREIVLLCDCGARGHLSAYASGRGIDRILRLLAEEGTPWLAADTPLTGQFAQAVASGEPAALDVLDAVTRPLAHALLSALSTDAEIDGVVLTGGVPAGLGPAYLASLTARMDAVGLYGHSGSLADKVRVAPCDAEPALHGAGMLARSGAAGARSWTVPGDQPKSYSVVMAPDMLASGRNTLRRAAGLGVHGAARRRLVVADKRVWELYGDALTDALTAGSGDVDLETLVLELDESRKGLPAVAELADAFDRFGLLRRSEPVIAVGGGVLLDLVSFTASVYRRGVPHIKVPTTLLGMIDAGIGVKTAINYGGHKSRLGTYCPPSRVVIDPGFLRTLDPREYRCGLGESIKIALVADAELFDLLDTHSRALAAGTPDPRVETEVIERSIAAMLGELVGNLCENRLERLADIGHAFSGALEMCVRPTLLHGEAVAIDLALTVQLSRNRGLLPTDVADRALRVLADLGLPLTHREMSLDLLTEALANTSLHRDGQQRLPLLTDIGRAVFVNDVTETELAKALDALRAVQEWRVAS